jgi:photosystem II stability/assembly factor-like uncharacterized protein
LHEGILNITWGVGAAARWSGKLSTERISIVWFVTERTGWAAATSYRDKDNPRNVILHSQDGGRSWAVQKRDEQAFTGYAGVWFADEWNGRAVGEANPRSLISWMRDGGRTWQSQERGERLAGF